MPLGCRFHGEQAPFVTSLPFCSNRTKDANLKIDSPQTSAHMLPKPQFQVISVIDSCNTPRVSGLAATLDC